MLWFLSTVLCTGGNRVAIQQPLIFPMNVSSRDGFQCSVSVNLVISHLHQALFSPSSVVITPAPNYTSSTVVPVQPLHAMLLRAEGFYPSL